MVYILPRHERRHNSKRLVDDGALLIHHEEVGRSSTGSDGLLAMFDGPLQLLGRDHYLAKDGVYPRLSGIATCRGDDGFLVLEDIPTGLSAIDP